MLHVLQNHTVERFWPEVSSRVNYPIKACLIEMNIFDIDAETHKFCVSWFCLRVATIGCPLCVKSWNSHSASAGYVEMWCIQLSSTSYLFSTHTGKGVPNRLASVNGHTQPVSPQDIPSVYKATQQFETIWEKTSPTLAPSVRTHWLTIPS